MKDKVEAALREVLPESVPLFLSTGKNVFSKTTFLRIIFAASDHEINNVRGQMPQVVSLCLDLDTMELECQVFGGNGGRTVYREPNQRDPKEKYLAMVSCPVPFRRPKREEEAVLRAVKKFAQNWLKTMRENRAKLMYQDIVDYDAILA